MNKKQLQQATDKHLRTVGEARHELTLLVMDMRKAKSTAGLSKISDRRLDRMRKIRASLDFLECQLLDELDDKRQMLRSKELLEANKKVERDRLKAEKKQAKAVDDKKTSPKKAKVKAKTQKPVAAFPFPADPPAQASAAQSKMIAMAPAVKAKLKIRAAKTKKSKTPIADGIMGTPVPRPGPKSRRLSAIPSPKDTPLGSLQSDGGSY
jgi:hypothetical protein